LPLGLGQQRHWQLQQMDLQGGNAAECT
jgi:hypothetical protein